MKRRSAEKPKPEYIRISLSIPKDLWPFFERMRKQPQHAGNRSSYVRSLIIEKMQEQKTNPNWRHVAA